MKSLTFSDEKLYRISADDYGDPVRRACGTVLYSLAKGVVIAVGVAFFFAGPRLVGVGRQGGEFFLAVSLSCAVGVGIVDRRVFICEVKSFLIGWCVIRETKRWALGFPMCAGSRRVARGPCLA